MSLPIEEVIATLRDMKLPPDIIIKIENELEAKEAEKKEDKAANGPKAKNQYVTILLDPENKLDGLGDFVSLVAQLPEDVDVNETLPRLVKSIYDQKAACKRKVKNIESIADAASGVKRKFFKENRINIKTKEPVRVIISNNAIPAA